MTVREYAGAAGATSLSGDISAAATSINVVDGTGYPTGGVGPFVLTISAGLASEEKVLCISRTGNTFAVDAGGRGWDGTTAYDHENAATVQHTFSATDAREANEHVNDTTGDPHPQYLTPAEGAVLYAPVGDYATTAELEASQAIQDATIAAIPTGLRAVTGTYTGNGVSGRVIEVGFRPVLLLISGNSDADLNNNYHAIVAFGMGLYQNEGTDRTLLSNDSAVRNNVPALTDIGFDLLAGPGDFGNLSGKTYNYTAIG